MSDDLTMQRLDKQIEWYSGHAAYNQWLYRSLKLVVIVAAALIPFLSGMPDVKPPQYIGASVFSLPLPKAYSSLTSMRRIWKMRAQSERFDERLSFSGVWDGDVAEVPALSTLAQTFRRDPTLL